MFADSPFVALAAARYLNNRTGHPRAVIDDPDFREHALDRFRDELFIGGRALIPQAWAQRLFDVLAALSPVRDAQAQDIATFIGAPASEVIRALGELEEAGVIRRDQGGIRISPDVLNDFVLRRAMFSRGGLATGFHQEMLAAFPAQIPTLLRNVSELDWGLRLSGTPTDVVESVWVLFKELFIDSSPGQKAALLEDLVPVGYFQPRRVLEFVEFLADDAPQIKDPQDVDFRDFFSYEPQLRARLGPLLRGVAFSKEFLRQALDLLWALAREDPREPAQNPEHPLRILTEALEYGRKPLWVQGEAAKAFVRWTSQENWTTGRHDPMVVADALLAKVVMATTWRQGGFTLGAMRVDAGKTKAVRLSVVQQLGHLARQDPALRGRVLAAQSLLNALAAPESYFAHQPSPEEDEAFLFQYHAALDELDLIMHKAADSLVRMVVANGIRRFRYPVWRSAKVRRLILQRAAAYRENRAMRLLRAYARSYDERLGDWRKEQKRQDAAIRKAAEEFLVRAHTPEEIWSALQGLADECRDAGGAPSPLPQPGYFLHEIGTLRPDVAVDLLTMFLCEVELAPRSFVSALLGTIAFVIPEAFTCLLRASQDAGAPALRAEAIWALASVTPRRKLVPEERRILERALKDEAAVVRHASLRALHNVSWHGDVATAWRLLPHIRLRGDVALARDLNDLFFMVPETEPVPSVSASWARRLSQELATLPALDIGGQDLDHLLKAIAHVDPVGVAKMLVSRARQQAKRYSGQGERIRAFPFHGLLRTKQILRESGAASVRRIFAEAIDAAERADDYVMEHLLRDGFPELVPERGTL